MKTLNSLAMRFDFKKSCGDFTHNVTQESSFETRLTKL